MLNLKQRKRITRVVNKLLAAYEDCSWKGSKHPDDWDEIELAYKKAKENYKKVLDSLTIYNGQ